jgi:ankyrin repeat protein
MRALAAAGADIRFGMKSGETPLLAAAGMSAGAQADRRGLSILDGGRIEDESRVVETVAVAIANGADVNEATPTGETALHVAAVAGYDRVIRQLADAGAKVDLKNACGATPEMIAGKGAAPRSPDRTTLGPRQSTVDLLCALSGTRPSQD